jgi:hypothetical protein
MSLFEWRSDCLKRYSQGSIFVVADGVEAARRAARAAFDGHLRDRFDYLFLDGQPMDEDCREELECRRRTLEDDIAKEPILHDGPVFVLGSE